MLKRRKGLAALVILAAIGLWCFLNSSFFERQRFYRFDAALWSASNPEQRYFMATYLVDSGTLIGKTKEEVVALLGKPTRGGDGFVYNLGPERGSMFQIDDDWLDLTFSGDPARVKKAYIRPD